MANAQEMVDALTNAMAKNAGVKQIVVDGQTITFNSLAEMQAALVFWETRAARPNGRRRIFRSMNMGGGGILPLPPVVGE